MSIVKEFKEFAVKGSAVELAVGIIIGAAFSKIVSSLVTDIIMPPLGLLLGGVDYKSLKIIIKPAVAEVPAVTINYGQFINSVVDFLIVAFAVFIMVKAINKIRNKK